MKRTTMEPRPVEPLPGAMHGVPPDPPSMTARRPALGGGFESLAEEVTGPTGERHPLAPVLEAHVQQLRSTDDPQADAVQAAVIVIQLLDRTDQTGHADQSTCQTAIDLLLQLGQPKLLCRLAEVTGFPFWLNVDARPAAADVLVRMAEYWPRSVGASLILDTTMPSDVIELLHDFIKRPGFLNLHVIAEKGTESPAAAGAFACAVKLRKLKELSIICAITSVDVLRAMAGVLAEAISIHDQSLHQKYRTYVESQETMADLDANSSPNQLGALGRLLNSTQSALTVLVGASGAKILDVAGSLVTGRMSMDIALALLQCRDHWDLVRVHPFNHPAVWDWLKSGKHTVGELNICGWEPGVSTQPLDVLQWAERSRVHTIVFHGNMNLVSFARALERYLLRSSHVFEKIEACFFTKEDAPYRLMALEALVNNPIVVTTAHRPPTLTGLKRALSVLGAEETARLNGRGATNRMLTMEERSSQVRRAAEQRKAQITGVLADFLDERRSTAELANYLNSPSHILPAPSLAFEGDVKRFRTPLAKKLKLLQLCKVDTEFVKGAIAAWVNTHPTGMAEMCEALIRIGFATASRTEEEWRGLGLRFAGARASNSSNSSDSEWTTPWTTERRELTQLFSVDGPEAFHTQLVQASTRVARKAQPKAKTVVLKAGACDTVLRKVRAMQQAAVPDAEIVQAVGQVWREGPQTNPAYLEALAYLGVVPPEVWLAHGIGIDIQAQGARSGT